MNSTSNQLLQPTTSSLRKRKTKSPPSAPPSTSHSPSTKWRSEKQQQIYTTKLARALRDLRVTQPSSSFSPPRDDGRAVREVADRALAVTARGKTRWSRAMISKAVKLKLRKHKRRRLSNPVTSPAVTTGSLRSKTVTRVEAKGVASVQRKVRALSRLVPGCRKQTLPVVLEETTDYIAAMEMQIRTMTAILSAVSSPTGHEGGQTHVLDFRYAK
ncbi:transcription factor bHLH147-like isoform X2 [Raphanus sativus]|uniref:Transcription factor bHLH147-like isoform X2 n=1 Tax=Raphanus sativus TaxID=3726 RepID=A0A6J0JQZ0_RAPSA|nr:transcription factor bHLH147-like isoform X2 [Raphanus sativus]